MPLLCSGRRREPERSWLASGLAVCLALLVGQAARAGDPLLVTSNRDDGVPGTLRNSLGVVLQAGVQDDTIPFALPPNLPDDRTIQLTRPLQDIDLAIQFADLTVEETTTAIEIAAMPGSSILATTGNLTFVDVFLSGGSVSADATLVFSLSVDAVSDTNYLDLGTGSLGLTKDGGGTLTLLGSNAYSGATSVRAGTLVGDTESLPGDILSVGTVVFDQGMDGTYGGRLSGGGVFEKLGAGTLTMSGANVLFTGQMTVNGGTLAGTPASIPGGVDIRAGSLQFDITSGEETWAGALTGTTAGELLKTGAGTLRATGTNSFPGITRVEEGTLDARTLSGAVELLSATALRFDQPTSGDFSGDISGDGALVKLGAGTLVLGGQNSYRGGTSVMEGTLQGDAVSLQGNIDNEGAVVFEQSETGTFDDVISGSGSLEKTGGGTLAMSQPQAYSGDTLVSAGTLLGNGFDGSVNIASGAAFGGGGTVGGSLVLGSGSTLSPGGSLGAPGSLGVSGGLAFEDGSSLLVDASDQGGGLADLVFVAGAVDVGVGVAVQVVPTGQFQTPVDVPILAYGSRAGSFLDPVDTLFLSIDLDQTIPNQVRLRIQSVDAPIATFAATANQLAVASALDAANGNATPSLQQAIDDFSAASDPSQVQDGLDLMSGEAIADFTTSRLAIARRLQSTIQSRMRDVYWYATDPLLAGTGGGAGPSGLLALGDPKTPAAAGSASFAGSPRSSLAGHALPVLGMTVRGIGPGLVGQPPLATQPGDGPNGLAGWLDGYGIHGDLDGDGNSANADYGMWGVSLGFDWRPADAWIVGLAGGYAWTDLEVNDRESKGDSHTFQGALYGGWVDPHAHVGLSARWGFSDIDNRREISLLTVDERARAKFEGHELGGRIEAGVNVLSFASTIFEPLVFFDYAHLRQQSFSETNAPGIALEVEGERFNSLLTGVGGRIVARFDMGDGYWMRPELRGFWTHEFGDTDRTLTARFSGDTTRTKMVIHAAELARDSGIVGIGWSIFNAAGAQAFIGYDAVLNRNLIEHNFALGLRVLF